MSDYLNAHNNQSHSALIQQYISVNGRYIHYRQTGHGPAVVLLHDSPRSSRLHIETMQRLSHSYTVYALDTPGYGNSAPLDIASPNIKDFADALAAALEQLGLSHAPLYATHTSAKIALEYAANHPRKAPIILDGLSIPAGPPNDNFINAYMRPMTIEATGGYLAAEWTRMRDMVRWFPWFHPKAETRMAMAQPSDEWLADYAIDFFAAGPHYSSAYRAAMYYNPMPALLRVKSPILIAAKSDDVLYSSLDRVPTTENPVLTVERLSADREEWLLWLENSLKTDVAAPAERGKEKLPARSMIATSLGAIHLHCSGLTSSDSPPLLLLSTPTILQALLWQKNLPNRLTLLPELPGFGDSTPLAEAGLDEFADALIEMLIAAEHAQVDILAANFTAALALRIASRAPSLIRSIILDGCPNLGSEHCEKIAPSFAFDGLGGAHNHRYWHMLRDGEANFPWFSGDIVSQRSTEPMIDAEAMHQALVGILKQPDHYGDAARILCGANGAVDAEKINQPCLIFQRANDAAYSESATLAAAISNAKLIERPISTAETAEQITLFLDSLPRKTAQKTEPAA